MDFAYKYSSLDAITTLRDILIPSREDRPLTPVGELTPIEIGGTTNSRATFHNIKISKDFFKMNKNIINHPIKKRLLLSFLENSCFYSSEGCLLDTYGLLLICYFSN